MKRRSFVKFLSLLPVATFFNAGDALAEIPEAPVREMRPNPTLAEALRFSPPQRGELVVIASRPSVGKSAFMLNLMDRFRNEGSLFFSLEMSNEEVLHRWRETSQYPIPSSGLSNIDFDDTNGATPKYIWSRVEAATFKSPDFQYVYIDYLQLMPWFEGSKGRIDLADAILRRLKRMAVELNVAVILSAQLNREHNSGSTPRNLRGVTDLSPIDRLVIIEREPMDDDVTVSIHRPQRAVGRRSPRDLERSDSAEAASLARLRHFFDKNRVALRNFTDTPGRTPTLIDVRQQSEFVRVANRYHELYKEYYYQLSGEWISRE